SVVVVVGSVVTVSGVTDPANKDSSTTLSMVSFTGSIDEARIPGMWGSGSGEEAMVSGSAEGVRVPASTEEAMVSGSTDLVTLSGSTANATLSGPGLAGVPELRTPPSWGLSSS